MDQQTWNRWQAQVLAARQHGQALPNHAAWTQGEVYGPQPVLTPEQSARARKRVRDTRAYDPRVQAADRQDLRDYNDYMNQPPPTNWSDVPVLGPALKQIPALDPNIENMFRGWVKQRFGF